MILKKRSVRLCSRISTLRIVNHRNLGTTAIVRTFHPAAFIRTNTSSTYIVSSDI